MSIYEPVFSAFGLTEWCQGDNGKGDNLTSLTDLAAKQEEKGQQTSHCGLRSSNGCTARVVSGLPNRGTLKGYENVFLDIKDSLSLVLIHSHSRLAGF